MSARIATLGLVVAFHVLTAVAERGSTTSTALEMLSDLTISRGVDFRAEARPVEPSRPTAEPLQHVSEFPVSCDDYYQVFDFSNWNWTIEGVVLGGDDVVSLDLTWFNVLSHESMVVVETADGTVPLNYIPVALFRGSIRGEADTWAYIALSPYAVYGMIVRGHETYIVSSGPAMEGRPTLVYPLSAENAAAIGLRPLECGSDLLPVRHGEPGEREEEGGIAGVEIPCRVAQVAVETDEEFTAMFGGDTTAAAAYAVALLGANSEIYRRDTNARIEISFLRLWTTTDPWTSDDTIDQLFQFQDYWNVNMTHVSRNAAHYLSPRRMARAGGVAYLPGLCQQGYDYGLSAYLNGFFPYPLQNNNSQNWDVMVTAHELGHNFGARHTHSMDPPIDGCAFGDCSAANTGTIMSYCHTCPGGMSNIVLVLHPRTVLEDIWPYLASLTNTCNLDDPIQITTQPTGLARFVGQTAVFQSAANHTDAVFQWRRNGVPLSDGGRISGAATPVLTILAVQPGDAGVYSVRVTNACGVVISAGAQLTVSYLTGDMNCDGVVDNFDIDPFVLALTNPAAYAVQYPGCNVLSGDVNQDGVLNNFDIDPFVNLLTGG